MRAILHQKLEAAGYHIIESNIPELCIYYQTFEDKVNSILLLDSIPPGQLGTVKFNAYKTKVYDLFNQKGYVNIDLLTLIITDDVQGYRPIISQDTSHWVIDSTQNRLYIYEYQPSDYYGLSAIVSELLEQSNRIKTPMQGKSSIHELIAFLKSRSIINLLMIVINITIFIILEWHGSTTADMEFMIRHGAAYVPLILEEGQFYRLFTCMFLHFGVTHLFNNMLVLFALGDLLEKEVGNVRYLIIYIIGGLGGSVASLIYQAGAAQNTVSAGASGCIFAVIGALLYIVLVNRGRLETITTYGLVIMIGITLYHGFTSTGIDNMAHIGGLVSGFLLACILYRRRLKTPG